MSKVEIKNRFNGSILFSCEIPPEVASGLEIRHALEKAVLQSANLQGAYLQDANLQDAYLQGANLQGAYLQDAVLQGANLQDAYLQGANLQSANLRDANGKNLRSNDEQAIENLDKVRAIILDDQKRLEMGHWHQTDEWKNRTCAEETLCNTTHCLAGWLQVCSTIPEIKELDAQLAGILSAPVASKMFFRKADEVLNWLETRAYVDEMKQGA